jgi:spermidine/putrescine transport system substrate-binding protein
MIDRRRLLAGAAVAPFVIQRSARAAEPLRVLGWFNYVDQGVIDRFKELTGIEVQLVTIGAYDEIFTQLRAGGIGFYSVIAPHHGLLPLLYRSSLVQSLDLNRIPRFLEIDSRFLLPATTEIGGGRYAVPLVFGTSPCIYNAAHLPEPPNAWADLDSPVFDGKVGMLDDGLGHFMQWGKVAGSESAPHLSLEEFERTDLLLTSLKRNRVSHFTPYVNDLAFELARGKAIVTTTGWEGMLLLPEAAGIDLRIARPVPGDYSWVQTLAIPQDAPQTEAAHQFIDFMLSAEEQAALSLRIVRGVVHPAAGALIPEPIHSLLGYPDLDAVLAHSPILDFPPVGETTGNTATYLDWVIAWEQIRLTESQAAP